MTKKNILILCAGGSAPIFFARRLRKKFNIFLADGSDRNAAPHLKFPFTLIPFGNNKNFLIAIDAIVKKKNIHCIVPGADEELLPISNYRKKHKIIAVIPSHTFIELCLHKRNLMVALRELKISRTPTFTTIRSVRYPAIIKPVFGRGSRGVHVINSSSEIYGYLRLYKKKLSDVLIQRYIEGEEYTISVIVNNLNKLIGIVPKKIIVKKEITRAAIVEKNNTIIHVCEKIVQMCKPHGPFNVQLKLFKNKAYVFEINPRLSTTAVLTDKAFGNEIELYLRYYNKNVIQHQPTLKNNLALYRYEENIFVE